MTNATDASPDLSWREVVARYQRPSVRAAVTQLVTTLVPFLTLLVAMYWTLSVSYWLTLGLGVVAAGFMVRTFIIMHDCGHGSFLPSRRWNDIVGFATGVLTLTPYVQWRRDHAIHHATSGNLDDRGVGDISTLTIREYLALGWFGRFRYRVYRNPLVMFGIGPLWLMLQHRIKVFGAGRKEAVSVMATNLVLAAIVVGLGFLIGWKAILLIWFPVFMIGGAAGIWLFYVQHQFEDTYWAGEGEWNYATAAIQGSSYLKLPRPLEWITGYIGVHHVHHLSPRIPNYFLRRCHEENPMFHSVRVITFGESLKTIKLKLWDEDARELVSFREFRRRLRGARA